MCLQPIKVDLGLLMIRSILIESKYKESDFKNKPIGFEKEYETCRMYLNERFNNIVIYLCVTKRDNGLVLNDIHWYDQVPREYFCDKELKLN